MTTRIYPAVLIIAAVIFWLVPDKSLGHSWLEPSSQGDLTIMVLLATGIIVWEIRDAAQWIVKKLGGNAKSE
jgi:hypothetical protein